jgi:UDP-N-acetylglucosamine acyltransferase
MQSIHPTAFVGPGVSLGSEVTVGPHAVILGPTSIGDRVWVGPGAQIGAPPEISSLPQRAAWAGDVGYEGVRIDDDAVIRENVVIHQGSHRSTRVGEGSWILNSAYIAHDVLVGARVTVSAGVRIGGHSVIGRHANLGMSAVVHQRRTIGPGAMVGMGTPVARDVPPFAKVYGSPARIHGSNEYVLRELGASPAEITALAHAYGGAGLADDPAAGWGSLSADFAWRSEQGDVRVMPTANGHAS